MEFSLTDRSLRIPTGDHVNHAGEVEASASDDPSVVRQTLPRDPFVQGLGVDVHQMYFAVVFEKRLEVEIIAVPRPQDAEPPLRGIADEEFGDTRPMRFERRPVIPAQGIERDLPCSWIFQA